MNQYALVNKPLGNIDAVTSFVSVNTFKRVAQVLFRRLQRRKLSTKTLVDCLHNQDGFKNGLFFFAKHRLLREGIKNQLYIRCKIVFAFFIEEIPKHINRQQRMVIKGSGVFNKPLESLDIQVLGSLDKIKHTALIRLECGSDIFQYKCSNRMQRQNIAHYIMVCDIDRFHNGAS